MTRYPIDPTLPELMSTLMRAGSAVLHAPPGAGKTTRVPLALMDALGAGGGRIVMLEPRRIAASSAARWMARTLGEPVGQTVGYSIRFDSRTSASTRIEVVTEGILTRRIQSDPGLEGVSVVILDEFHERGMNADLALALCLDIKRNLRDDLKLLVMSATLDCGPISDLMDSAPVISSEGRAFDVEERHIDFPRNTPLAHKVRDGVRRALTETEGDILVFLPGAGEIRASARELGTMFGHRDDISIHTLFGDMPFEEQERAILPSDRRRIVLATNIAETSLTIEGVRVVIDSGLTRRLEHDPSSGINRLVTVTTSRASAAQRKGRAGRLAPGICYRLYGRQTAAGMVAFSPPEIMLADLSSLVLELALWGTTEPSGLSWLSAPPEASWQAARELLFELGAIDSSGSPTALGRDISRLPLHPRLARMLLRAGALGLHQLGSDLCALLSERDIMRRSPATARETDIASRLDLLHAWRRGREVKDDADISALRTVQRISDQLAALMKAAQGPSTFDHDEISRLMLDAYPDRIGMKRGDESGRFILTHGKGVRLSTSEPLAQERFIVAANIDAAGGADGTVRIAAAVTEELIREEQGNNITRTRSLQWDARAARIAAQMEERLGALCLSSTQFTPDDDEALPILMAAVRENPALLKFDPASIQLKARVSLLKRTFPDADWPDMSDEHLMSTLEGWLGPWLCGVRSAQALGRIDLHNALNALMSWEQRRELDRLAPTHIPIPSGRSCALDYTVGETPVLAVKLQEMFGQTDTPTIADGRVRVLLHLLSPAKRPVQITSDLRGFWTGGYQLVKKDLKGRYPRHPWPDDPLTATATAKAKPRN